MSDIQQLSWNIKELVDDLHERFIQAEEAVDKKDREFFERVKVETKPMFELAKDWLSQAEEFVKRRDVNVHPTQVQSTYENVEMLILHGYYADVPKKRFKEMYRSVHYVVDMILTDWENREEAE
ncbi:DUF1798 family protein [Thalassobacillus sp. CUG 92003]|uniref:DUF1798 family protein n=1 Tax=Thalassobacillus sp. CUG 92003 TaxID=2736641 RepID=UPI0015E67FEF|nr:DUF1798 family protein [Thalassobacillus sp. CUG 92003]